MNRDENIRLAVLIFARDEACVIGETVGSVLKMLRRRGKLFVIADNCTDDTARIASDAGACVCYKPERDYPGKGDALAWFLDHYQEQLQPYGYILVLDADSQIGPDFFENVISNMPVKGAAFQCCVMPLYERGSPVSTLAALSYLLDQFVSDRIRTKLGWPVRLRGTGMLIKTGDLVEISDRLETKVEDIALSLLLTSKGVHIGRIEEARVFDPVPSTASAATRQRARWFRGQWHAMWKYRREILAVLAKGPSGWSLLTSLFLKPRWLISTASLVLALALSQWWWLSGIFWGYVLYTFLYFTGGLIMIPNRLEFIRALLHLPSYAWMWVRSIILSVRSSSWLKAREKR